MTVICARWTGQKDERCTGGKKKPKKKQKKNVDTKARCVCPLLLEGAGLLSHEITGA